MANLLPEKEKLFSLIKRGIIELASVFVAILLALWVDDWHEDKQRQQRIQLAMSSVTAELKANYTALQKAHAFQSETLDIIRAFSKDKPNLTDQDARELLQQMYQRSMFYPAQTLDTAWQVLMQSQLLNYMQHDTVLKYAQHYRKQQDLLKRQDSYMQTMNDYRINSESESEMLQLYYHTVNEIWWGEKNLLESFKKLQLPFVENQAEAKPVG